MYHSQQHRMQNCQFLYLRESFGYNRELFVCPSCVHRVAIGRLRVCVGSILAFYQIRDENRAKLKISYSCGHRVSKSARYDATLMQNFGTSIVNLPVVFHRPLVHFWKDGITLSYEAWITLPVMLS